MTFALLAVALVSVPRPPLDLSPAGVVVAAKCGAPTIGLLDGRWARVQVVPTSDPWAEGDEFITEVATGPGGHTWTVWGSSPLDEPATVRGCVRVIRHPPAVHFGQRFEGFVEVRVYAEQGTMNEVKVRR
jgi:hypothetical protein